MNHDFSMEYGDFLRECGRFDPEFMLTAHLSTVRSFCLSLHDNIDSLTASDMHDLRDTLIQWLEDDDTQDGNLLKGGCNLSADLSSLQSNRAVFNNAVRYLKKASSQRSKLLPPKQISQKSQPVKTVWSCDTRFSRFYENGLEVDNLAPHSAASKIIATLYKQGKALTLKTLQNKGAEGSLRRRAFFRHKHLYDCLLDMSDTPGKKARAKIMVTLKHPLSVLPPGTYPATK